MTDHYADIREKHEEEALARRAEQAGRNIKDQRFYEKVFLLAKKIHSDEIYRRNMIKIYEDNKEKFE